MAPKFDDDSQVLVSSVYHLCQIDRVEHLLSTANSRISVCVYILIITYTQWSYNCILQSYNYQGVCATQTHAERERRREGKTYIRFQHKYDIYTIVAEKLSNTAIIGGIQLRCIFGDTNKLSGGSSGGNGLGYLVITADVTRALLAAYSSQPLSG